ncbi:MAG: hypothetical protein NTZ51_09675 [Proteobacteria bacterium]|nr:hypothetical protein [Pseudomonadota bacterium]
MNIKTFVTAYKDEIVFALLFVYIIILSIGVIGELFDIEWIRNLPLFKL